MSKFGRKLTSALLTLAMFVSLLPIGAAPAQAADPTSHDISQSTLTISEDGDYTVTGTTTTNRIVVGENVTATVTLNGVNITGAEASIVTGASAQSPIDLSTGATLTLILKDNSSNTITGGIGGVGGTNGAPGIHVPDEATLIIYGSGSLTVTGGSSTTNFGGTGIGGAIDDTEASSGVYRGEDCGTVIILSSGTVNIVGGSSLMSGSGGADIGGGQGAGVGGEDGSNGQGIRPVSGQENTYTVWGNLTLPCDITIPQGTTVTIPNGASLTVPEGTKLINNGTIVKQQGGTFTNNGTLDGNPLGYPSTVTVANSGNGVTTENMVAYGTTATVTATVTGNNQPASDGTVTFYRGEASDENKINETPAKVSNGKATTTVSLSGENWTPSETSQTITAVYTPGESNQLRPGNGKSSLTIQPKTLTASLGGTLTKTYDGNTDAPEGIKIELEGVVSGENVSASSKSISYGDANVGTGKTITASDVELSGENARNYTLGSKTTITTDAGVITAAEMTGSVTISGTPTVGGTLKATYSGGNATEISYQWYRGNEAISGATETSYTLTADDAGKSVSVCVTASGNYSGSVESTPVTVNKTEQSAPETGAGYKIDYAAETISAENGYELAATKDANVGSAALTVTPGTDVYIRLAETATAYASDWTLVDVPARPAAPANVSGGTEQISGVDSSMEYRAVGSTGWTRCSGTSISNLSDGDYEVRIAATNNSFASEAVQVHVSPYTGKYSYEISTNVGDNGTISVDRYATEGERVTITVSPDDAYKLDDLSVTARGKDVELTDNGDCTYTFTMPSGDVKISATFAEDPDWTEPEEPATDVSEIFIDVAPNAWYKVAVQYAYDNGLMTGVSGTGDGNFSPNAAITREQLAAMLMNYSAWKGEDVSARADLSTYSDQPSTWATETMQWAVAEGLISGVTADQLQPQGNATRAQVAAILQRFLKNA